MAFDEKKSPDAQLEGLKAQLTQLEARLDKNLGTKEYKNALVDAQKELAGLNNKFAGDTENPVYKKEKAELTATIKDAAEQLEMTGKVGKDFVTLQKEIKASEKSREVAKPRESTPKPADVAAQQSAREQTQMAMRAAILKEQGTPIAIADIRKRIEEGRYDQAA